MIRVIVLVENFVQRRGLRAEHGLAFWIETPAQRVLFDAGQTGETLMHNARELGIDLSTADTFALSHGHYDHTGGLAAALALAPHARVVMHPHARLSRYVQRENGSADPLGMPPDVIAALDARVNTIHYERRPYGLGDGVWLTGEIPRTTTFEHGTDGFFLDADCTMPDGIADDQALFFDSGNGVVVLLGCSHSGVINTLEYVRALTRDRPFAAVIGGMHLRDGADESIRHVTRELRRLTPRMLVPLHCTSFAARVTLANALSGYTDGAVGATFEFRT
jgi:7,8-dihydropterin-6-yl-methyl-4-(beta-D-ribofuranosyl)aminobenzene 5'-phosphate synthase